MIRARRRQQDRAAWELAAGPGFSPRDIPEVAAGYYWEAGNTSGIGTAAFKVIEGNGHSAFDLIQATVANQPTVLTENGGTQFRFEKFSVHAQNIATTGSVTAGWTGATYFAGWFRFPDGFTGTTNLMSHAGNPRLSVGSNTASGTLHFVTDLDGVTPLITRFPVMGAGYHWVEAAFDPLFVLGGSTAAERAKLFYDFAAQTPSLTASVGATLNDASGVVRWGPVAAGGTDRLDTASCYYANGIPSLANRVRLANHRNPTGVLLA